MYEFLSSLTQDQALVFSTIFAVAVIVTACTLPSLWRMRSHDPDLASARMQDRPSFEEQVGAAVERAMLKIEVARLEKSEADGREHRAKLARLEQNPWHEPAWNMTQQIMFMRADFDHAQRIAAEAGVDISHLRHRMDVPNTAVVDYNFPLPMSEEDYTAHGASRRDPSPAYQVDPSYFPCFSDPAASRRANRSLRPDSVYASHYSNSPEAVAMARVEATAKNRNDRANKSRKARRRIAKARALARPYGKRKVVRS